MRLINVIFIVQYAIECSELELKLELFSPTSKVTADTDEFVLKKNSAMSCCPVITVIDSFKIVFSQPNLTYQFSLGWLVVLDNFRLQ